MIVIGKKNCGACEMTKNILTQKNIPFTYLSFEEFDKAEQEKYIELARSQGKIGLPIIIKDNICLTIQDILKGDL